MKRIRAVIRRRREAKARDLRVAAAIIDFFEMDMELRGRR